MNHDNSKARIAPEFFLCTAPEMDALERAAADGKHDLNYSNLPQVPTRIHQIAGASHFVRLEGAADAGESPSETEVSHAEVTAALEALSGAQDADATLALLYISHLLAPPAPLPPNLTATGHIDFDDVIAKIGWDPRSTAERREMHARLYKFLLFAERAKVVGQRRGSYLNKQTKEKIPTMIEAALLRIVKTETPEYDALTEARPTPTGVELVISREWAQLLTQPQTAQYLPLGELLGTIAGGKPSGAWARVIGLSLASFWRRQPKAALDGSIQPTRRELLERYPPKTSTVAETLDGPNPQRAVETWCGALQDFSGVRFSQGRRRSHHCARRNARRFTAQRLDRGVAQRAGFAATGHRVWRSRRAARGGASGPAQTQKQGRATTQKTGIKPGNLDSKHGESDSQNAKTSTQNCGNPTQNCGNPTQNCGNATQNCGNPRSKKNQ